MGQPSGIRFDVIDTVNDPGTPGKSGDDRFGFDAAAGTAWALDGATDVSDLRPFPRAESGAAWIADALSARLMRAPAPGADPVAYFDAVLADLRQRAEAESALPLTSLPGEARPVAAGIWMWLQGREAVFAYMGDSIAILRQRSGTRTIGIVEKVESETADARNYAAMSTEGRIAWLHNERRRSNAQGTAFGLGPAGARNLKVERIAVQPGDEACLMSDGLFRLVSPYQVLTPSGFMQALAEDGLLALVRRLRQIEDAPDSDVPRIKRRDDASGVYVRFEA
ncbi:MAG TPA: protein phosphatase 2C domain-containing protein [Hyphomonas sp.]|nr:protein phosphatase 2C domain-containing protein [Hyphomonas sp.]HPE47887.1 protein phosphatase 2C domain-containing protein [Hyphomonas sp.]